MFLGDKHDKMSYSSIVLPILHVLHICWRRLCGAACHLYSLYWQWCACKQLYETSAGY